MSAFVADITCLELQERGLCCDNDCFLFIYLPCLGVTACSITYPLDTVRCRLAFQVADEKLYLGIRHTIKKISGSEGGYVALYRGFCAQCLAMIPMIGNTINGICMVSLSILSFSLSFFSLSLSFEYITASVDIM